MSAPISHKEYVEVILIMATGKKDMKGRNLKPNEDQLNVGRYHYRYTDRSGKRQVVHENM